MLFGVADVELTGLPPVNVHKQVVVLDELFAKFTHKGTHPELSFGLNATVGNGFTVTVTVEVTVELQLSVTVTV